MSKTILILIGALVGAGMLYQMLERVPTDALNVALGVTLGIAASVPVSLGLFVALTRQRSQNNAVDDWIDPEPEPTRAPHPSILQQIPQSAQSAQMPQIIVLAPPPGQFTANQFPQGFPMPAQWLNQAQALHSHEPTNAVDAREWRIIGDDS